MNKITLDEFLDIEQKPDILKKCYKCGIEKDLTEFSKCKREKGGLQSNCKSCANGYRKENAEKMKGYNKEYHKENAEKLKEYKKEYYVENKEKINEYNKEYQKERILIDPLFKLTRNIRSLITNSFKNNVFKKSSQTSAILGCTFEEFKLHIENQFQPNMSWDNRQL